MMFRDHLHEVEADRAVTSSPAFLRWFGASAAVDAQGHPLVLYHGTSKDTDFKHFKMPKNGVWFTADRASASAYAVENDSQNARYDVERRAYVSFNTASRVIPVFLKMLAPKRVASLDQLFPAHLRHADNYRRAQGIVFDALRGEGFDSVIIGGEVYVMLDYNAPSKIKSAIGSAFTDKRNIHEN